MSLVLVAELKKHKNIVVYILFSKNKEEKFNNNGGYNQFKLNKKKVEMKIDKARTEHGDALSCYYFFVYFWRKNVFFFK